MKATDFIKLSLESSKGWIMGLAADIQDAPLQRATAGGNHPMWCLGHLVYIEGNLVNGLCKGEENPVADWADVFGIGTQPSDDASVYPPYEEVLAKLEEVRAGTMAYLDSISDDELDRPSNAEGDMKEWFPTKGACLAAVSTHFGFHGGQIADARRSAGRDVLMG